MVIANELNLKSVRMDSLVTPETNMDTLLRYFDHSSEEAKTSANRAGNHFSADCQSAISNFLRPNFLHLAISHLKQLMGTTTGFSGRSFDGRLGRQILDF